MTRRAPLALYLFAPLAALLGAVVVALILPTYRASWDLLRARTARDLEAAARVAERDVRPLLTASAVADVQRLCRDLGARSGRRYTVVLADGTVIGDSDEDPAQMDNHRTRPEMAEALQGRLGTSIRFSSTLLEDRMYLAVPIYGEGPAPVAALRTSVSIEDLRDAFASIRRRILETAAAVGLAAALVVGVLTARLARSVRRLRDGAERFAAGQLETPIPRPPSRELSDLTDALNRMARQLDERLSDLHERTEEAEAVIAGMTEGVIAVDGRQRVIRLNAAAAAMLGAQGSDVVGRDLCEVARPWDFQQFVTACLESTAPQEREIRVYGPDPRVLLARGSVLRDEAGGRMGAVIVIADLTQMHRLENLRREFVANVSHELRTPLTSIRGFVETLRTGDPTPEERERFLDIVGRQVERLHALVEDLLDLSRIEQQEGRTLEKTEAPLRDVLEAAATACQGAAEARGVRVSIDADAALRAPMDAAMIERALVNLLDNAIKYSEPGRPVEMTAAADGGEAVLSVRDRGPGIAAEHLPRLFERFYRVDKARSRQVGGTGLGLSIVKHIARIHGGRVSVESRPGAGSTFRIHLPAVAAAAPGGTPIP